MEQFLTGLSKLLDLNVIGLQLNLQKRIGSKVQTFREIVVNWRSYPGYEILSKIIQSIDWLNPDWLITGRVKMKKNDEASGLSLTNCYH